MRQKSLAQTHFSNTMARVDDTGYKVILDIFEGPLDLLLYLIKKEEVDIHEVSMEKITRQYLGYINTFRMLNIDLAAEFVLMAANLMYIKSRTLLPKSQQGPEEEAEDDDPRWDLIRQLIEYKKFKDAAAFLVKREGEIDGLFAYQPEMVVDEQLPALAEVSIFDLIRSFQNVLKRFEETHDFGSIVDDRFTVADKIELLLHRLQPGQSIQFEQIFQQATTKTEVIVTFLAILELMKMNQFVIRQNHILGEIEVERRMVGAGAASGGPVEAED